MVQLGTCAPCRHLFISSANLPWMEVNILNQQPCIPSWPPIFQFDILFSVVLSKSMCISVLGPSSSPSSSLVTLFIHSPFSLYFSGCHIFSQNHTVSLTSGCWYVFPVVDRIFFRCFGKACFVCIVLPFVDISLIFLLSSALSSLFPQVVLLFFLVLPGPFSSRLFQRPSFFIILVCFRSFLFAFPVEFPIPVLTLSSCFLRGFQFSHKLIFHLHRLVHLPRSYYSSLCKVVCDLCYSVLS